MMSKFETREVKANIEDLRIFRVLRMIGRTGGLIPQLDQQPVELEGNTRSLAGPALRSIC